MEREALGTITANFELKVGEDVLALSATVPDESVTAAELVPAFQKLTNALVDHSVAKVVASGKAISCRARCTACCTQPVPVTEIEAEHLAGVVARMPEPRRSQVRQRFADALAAIAEAGLEEELRAMPQADTASYTTLARRYFELHLDCPFLEDQLCGIYEDRPLECREYLVTSDPAFCAALDGERIERIDRSPSLVPAARRLSQESTASKTEGWMLLLFSLGWQAGDRPRARRVHGGEWLKRFIGLAIGRSL